MNLIAWLLSFALIENVVGHNAAAHETLLRDRSSHNWQTHVLTLVYLTVGGLISWVLVVLLARLLPLDFLLVPLFALLCHFLPRLIRLVFLPVFLQAQDWSYRQHYTYAAAFLVMILIWYYQPDFVGAMGASLGAAAGFWLMGVLYRGVMRRLSFERIPLRLRGLPLAFIIIGLCGLVLTASGAAITGLILPALQAW